VVAVVAGVVEGVDVQGRVDDLEDEGVEVVECVEQGDVADEWMVVVVVLWNPVVVVE